ncbi:transposase [Paracoccus saliphilus]|uniref:transposase n=1 Tax=Paracoccus saliphilus TaxID=405559 RepID=UPI00234FB6A7|nr:transposase [Paracoccus saliphilus]
MTGDGAYDARKGHDAIADRGAEAIIPPRKNAKPWKPTTAGVGARNEILRAVKYLVLRSGDDGANITVEVVSRQRCIV